MFSFSRSHPPSQSHISLLADFMTSQWCCVIHLSFRPPFSASHKLIGGLYDFTVVVCYLSLVLTPFTASRQLIGGLYDFTVVVCYLSLALTPITESRQLIGGLHDFTATLCFLSLVLTPIHRVTSAYWRTS